MAILAIVGCGVRLEVGLADGRVSPPALVALPGPTPRSELIVAAIDLVLRSAGCTPTDLTLVLATRGPGSFTGLRVALATAQGVARATGCRGAGVESLSVLAARATGGRRLAVQGARRGFVYVQPFEDGEGWPRPLAEARVEPVSVLAHSPDPVVAPEGLELSEEVPRAVVVRSAAEALLAFAAAHPHAHAPLSPVYLEEPLAVPPARRSR